MSEIKHTAKAKARSLQAVWADVALTTGSPGTPCAKGGIVGITKSATGILKITLDEKFDGIAGVACALESASVDVTFNLHTSTSGSDKLIYLTTLTGGVATDVTGQAAILVWVY